MGTVPDVCKLSLFLTHTHCNIFLQNHAEFTTGLNLGALNGLTKIPELCISATPKPNSLLKFDTCTATLGGTVCNSCQVCESGLDATFDCSNANFLFNIPLVVKECVGLGVLTNLDAAANSLPPIGFPSKKGL